MRQLLADKSFAVVISGSSPLQGALPVVKSQGNDVPVFCIGNAQIIATSGATSAYGILPNYTSEALLQTKFLIEKLHAKSIAIAYEDDSLGQGAGAAVPDWARAHGATSVAAVAIPATATNLGPYASKLQQTGADAVQIVTNTAISAALQKAAVAISYNPAWIVLASQYDPVYLQLAGSAAEGTYFDSYMTAVDSTDPSAQLFKAELTKRGPLAIGTLGATGWSIGAMIANVVAKATKGGSPLTKASFVNALKGLKGEVQGLFLSVDYSSKDHLTLANSLAVYRLTNGVFVKAADLAPVPTS
jgi:ABC-type branched-subunit amino acid transport system substrate-binding protein